MTDLAHLRTVAEACGPRLMTMTGNDVIELLDLIERPTLFETDGGSE